MKTARAFRALVVAALIAPPAAAPAQAETQPAPADTSGLADLTPAELLVRASSSALQYAALSAPASRLLVARHEESIPCLVSRLDTDDVRERIAVEDVLFRIGEPAVGPLVEALSHEARRTDTTRGARLAAGVLGRIGSASAVDALVAVHEHEDWKVRAAVAGALGGIGDPGSDRALVALLRDDVDIVRKSAAVSLAQVERKAPGTLDRVAADALLAALGDPFYGVRYGAAGALAAAGGRVAADLVALARAGAGQESRLAVRTLGDMRWRRALPALRALLRSPDWTMRAEAADAIGMIGPDGASRGSLGRLLREEPHPLVRALAAAAMGRAGR
ncbi:MAG: HEAT repeat domain-containing protein [Candidatus Eisenbacteria bacterium]|nr:HEAT repeat domain-containing protein [Candidatus Eisenbacteria bacterium]